LRASVPPLLLNMPACAGFDIADSSKPTQFHIQATQVSLLTHQHLPVRNHLFFHGGCTHPLQPLPCNHLALEAALWMPTSTQA
jgi:hypothetical protein